MRHVLFVTWDNLVTGATTVRLRKSKKGADLMSLSLGNNIGCADIRNRINRKRDALGNCCVALLHTIHNNIGGGA